MLLLLLLMMMMMMMIALMMITMIMMMIMMRQVELKLEAGAGGGCSALETKQSGEPRRAHVSTALEPEYLAQITCNCLLNHHCMLEVRSE